MKKSTGSGGPKINGSDRIRILIPVYGTPDTKSMKTKKEGFKNHLDFRISFNRLLKIYLRLRYRAPDPVFWGQNRILIPLPSVSMQLQLKLSVPVPVHPCHIQMTDFV